MNKRQQRREIRGIFLDHIDSTLIKTKYNVVYDALNVEVHRSLVYSSIIQTLFIKGYTWFSVAHRDYGTRFIIHFKEGDK